MLVTPFVAADLDDFDGVTPVPLTREQAMTVEQGKTAWTASVDGKVVACAGVVRLWEGRYMAWAYMSKRSGPHMRKITKAVDKYLDVLNARRVELTVRVGFKAGNRWAKLLGFELETERMRGYAPDGADHAMYVRTGQ